MRVGLQTILGNGKIGYVVRMYQRITPDVFILDVETVPGVSNIIQEIRDSAPSSKIMFLCGSKDMNGMRQKVGIFLSRSCLTAVCHLGWALIWCSDLPEVVNYFPSAASVSLRAMSWKPRIKALDSESSMNISPWRSAKWG